jgi:hypothetical protein
VKLVKDADVGQKMRLVVDRGQSKSSLVWIAV